MILIIEYLYFLKYLKINTIRLGYIADHSNDQKLKLRHGYWVYINLIIYLLKRQESHNATPNSNS